MAGHPSGDSLDLERATSFGNVRVLGWAALFNDAATEMSYWLLPHFLSVVLGAGPMAFGVIEGAAESAASLGRLLSGYISDRLRRRKPLVAAGYTVANLAKPLLALAANWQQVFWIRFADRATKGLRSAPRDALVAESVAARERGGAFGLLQAMDTAGAIAGPLAAMAVLAGFHNHVRPVFWWATLPGGVSAMLAWLAVREVRPGQGPRVRIFARGAFRQSGGRLPVILAAMAVFSLGNSSDLFLILRAQNLGMAASLAPALGLLFNVVYAALSWPLGKLSDRVPKRALVVAGFLVYAAVYFGFAAAHTPHIAWLLFPVYGLYYALTGGALKAWIADLAPGAARASFYGLFNWVVGVMAFPASLLAGWLWKEYLPSTTFYVSAALALAASGLLLIP